MHFLLQCAHILASFSYYLVTIFIECKGKEVTPFLDNLDMLHCHDFQLCDAKLH